MNNRIEEERLTPNDKPIIERIVVVPRLTPRAFRQALRDLILPSSDHEVTPEVGGGGGSGGRA